MRFSKARFIPALSVIPALAKALLVLALAVSCAFILSGCDENQEKRRVTVSVWDESLIGTPFTQKVEELNPNFDIYWICGKDDGDFYRFQNEHGSMPDVLLVSHLEENDELGQILFDLSASDDVTLRSEEVLSAIPGNEDRTVILPADDTFTGLLANQYLFDQYEIPMPHDHASLVAACQAFKQKGVVGIAGGFSDQETLFEFSQTVLSGFPASGEGELWRSKYREGADMNVLKEAWLPFFEEVERSIDSGLLATEELSLDASEARSQFVDGKAAMLFVSEEDLARFGDDLHMTVRALPNYPAESDGGHGQESEPWLLIRPAFYGAVSYVDGDQADVADSEQVHENALKVLDSIMSDEAQKAYFETMGMSVPSTVLDAADSTDRPVFDHVREPATKGAYRLAVTDPVVMQSTASAISWAVRNHGADGSTQPSTETDGRADQAGQDQPATQDDGAAQNGQASQGDEASQGDRAPQDGQAAQDGQASQGDEASQDSDGPEELDPAGSNTQMAAEEARPFEVTMLDGLPTLDGNAFDEENDAETSSALRMLDYAVSQMKALKDPDTRIIATFPEGMSNVWNEDRGTMAANSVGRTIATELGCDAFILSPYALACPLYAGDMTATQLAYPINDARIYRAKLTGAQLTELLGRHVDSAASGKELWVLSGLKMTVSGSDGSLHLEKLEAVPAEGDPDKASPIGQTDTQTVDTVPLEEDEVYDVGFAVKPGSPNEELVAEYDAVRQSTLLSDMWVNSFQGADPGSLLASQDYIDFVS